MSQKWVDRERMVQIQDVEPGAKSFSDVVIRPGESPFRVTAVVADDSEHFRLSQCTAGKKVLVKGDKGAAFPLTDVYAAVDVGGTITVRVENVSAERRSFRGKLIGKELVLD